MKYAVGKSIGTESGLVITRSWERGKGVAAKGYRASFQGGENDLTFNSVNILKVTEL